MSLSRRSFVRLVAGSSVALVIGFGGRRLALGETEAARLSKWIRLDPDGTITLTVGKMEMGQGVRTSLAMILAEELEADWSRVAVVNGTPGEEFPRLGTGGSGSVSGHWKALREAGAAAREMLVAAAAARWKADPAECRAEQSVVLHPPSGRRLAYGELAAEAAQLPLPAAPKLKAAADYRLIGRPTPSLDARDLVSGRVRYGCDARVPGMLHASLERPPQPGAKVAATDEKAALAVRGVRAVVPLNGGFAVVAESTWAALKGRKALAVSWEEPPPDAFDSARHFERLREAAGKPGIVIRRDEPPAGAPTAERTIEANYEYPFAAHAPLETMNATADVRDGECRLWLSTQAPNSAQKAVADRLGLALEKVQVTPLHIGGSFGRRLAVDYAVEAAELSRAVKAPVQVLWSRADDMRHGHFQAASVHRLSAGIAADGTVASWRHTKAGSFHNARGVPTPEQIANPEFHRGHAWGVYDVPYVIPDIEATYAAVDLPVKHGPWRAVFAPSSIFAREVFVDELAHAVGADPLAFRLQLLRGPDHFEAGDVKADRRRLRRVLEAVRDRSGWSSAPLDPNRGRGVTCNIYDGETYIAYVVEVTVAAGQVHVNRVVAAVDCGLVVNPVGVTQQVEGGVIWGISSALKGEITFRRGAAEQASYADFGVARITDAPVIETHLLPSDEPRPYGMGEPPVPPIIPAILNAVFAATGRRIRRLPLRPSDLA